MNAAISIFSERAAASRKFGTLNLPAACAYPARKILLEKILNRKFPDLPCPEVKDWKDRLQADRVSLVFVGAYASNAASIMGHTFLRLTNGEREDSHREGIDLLSYVVGYTAHTPPGDGRLKYMMKGLTGGYPGFYDIEPYYMKVGLYNNAESRDLWELPLNFSAEEVKFLSLVVWEYTFNVQINYYFIGKNCSYRLLTLLEAAKPELNVSTQFRGVTIPAETARSLIEVGMASSSPRFRPSIQRKLQEKMDRLDPSTKKEFKAAISSREKLDQVQSPTLLDALMDYWLHENFRVQTQLPQKQKDQMEATIAKAAESKTMSVAEISPNDIRKKHKLSPPFLGHRPKSLDLEGGGFQDSSGGYLGVNTRMGLQPVWLYDPSYQEISALEYLGVDLKFQNLDGKENLLWNLLLIRVQTLEDLWRETSPRLKPSWGFHIGLGNDCLLCEDRKTYANLSASFGASQSLAGWTFAVLPQLQSAVGAKRSHLAPGFSGLIKKGFGPWSLFLERGLYFEHEGNTDVFEGRISYFFSPNMVLSLKGQKETYGAHGVYFF